MATYCEVCSLQLNDDYAFRTHLTGKKHLRNYQQKEFQRKILENSIYVSPIPRYITAYKLIEFFLQFGSIESYKIGPNHVIITFDKREPVVYLLNNPIWINKTKLDIRKRILNNTKRECNTNNSTEVAKVIDFDSIKNIFEEEITFNSQLDAFLNAVLLSNTEVETRYESICKSLSIIFASVFPNCQTYRFGSTYTELGFKECDLDIYMDIGVPICDTGNSPWSMKKVFKQVKFVMYKMNKIFTDVVPIPKAKTPIIKFYHIPTKISCDISFKNGFGIYNSKLIKHCLSLDMRLKPLIIVIKYWARQYKISGCGKISNYALIMLIIFYLQQAEPYVLPPLREFQKTCIPIISNDWQVNFDENTVLPPITNNSNIPQLLLGFFEYYLNFQFKTYIICPWDGILHTKEEFARVDNLPNYMARYKNIATTDDLKLDINKLVCIQDPIELNRNVAASTSQQVITLFQKYCELGVQICTTEHANNYKNLLESLFSSVSKLENDQIQIVVAIYAGPYLSIGLPDNFENRDDIINKEQYKKDNWYFIIFNLVKDIFERVYKLKIEVLSADKEAKQQKIEILSDVHTKEHQQFLLHCTGSECTWSNRKSGVTHLSSTMNALDREASISDNVLEENRRRGRLREVKLDFICKFEKKDNPVHVQLELNNKNSGVKLFKEFGYLVRDKIRKIAMNTLMHMQQHGMHY
ncbi:speckle targeted PIP5K1A-regulated poly(A) polymerase-like [Vespa velutina]|uniref:speckle targeted PIP5K1A-regulated poly(A) polymerase-like n=1 Tax=Vespa velutina TaxID=202808 RepID=UPI001FB4D955|nr:speckle targeted PIP5K1A-regulated poly(A) polymerase-like [Vespa velutina]